MRYEVLIEQDEDGVFVATCPALPGCVSQGATRDEARANLADAMTGYMASLRKHGEAVHLSDAAIVEVGMDDKAGVAPVSGSGISATRAESQEN